MRTLGVPYPEGFDQVANKDLMQQANLIRINLKIEKLITPADAEIVALIAYMQRMGTDIKLAAKTTK